MKLLISILMLLFAALAAIFMMPALPVMEVVPAEIIAEVETDCNPDYTGEWWLDGEPFTLLCDGTKYYTDWIAMTEMKQQGYFAAVYCFDVCYSQAIVIEDGVMHAWGAPDNAYFEAVRDE